MSFWSTILQDLKALITKVESELSNAWGFVKDYVQEAFNEEEAALFPQIEKQISQLLQDEAATAGLTVKERVAMAVSELTKDMAVDAALAVQTLYNAYVWTVAHRIGLKDGNQGNLPGGNSSGT